jgi:hypothetical protein
VHQTYSTSSWTRVPDERMKSFGCDGIDNESESVRNEVFQVRTCHQTDWLVEFNNNVNAEKNLYSMKDNSLIKDVAAMTSIESDEQDILQKVDEISQKLI